MGDTQTKHWQDPQICMWMQVEKNFYLPGDTVRANLHLRAINDSQYLNIVIKFQGREYLHYKVKKGQANGKDVYGPVQLLQIYSFPSFQLVNFNGKLRKGDYTFPFTFKLNYAILGSFDFSENYYIRYELIATMENMKGANLNQVYCLPMNIIEIPLDQSTFSKNEDKADITGCFFTPFGTVGASISVNNNIICPGEPFEVDIQVNNTKGTNTIKAAKIYFERRFFRTTDIGQIQCKNLDKIIVGRVQQKINPGQQKKFKAEIVVPEKFNVPTALGHFICNYYILKLELEYQKLVFHSRPCPKIHIFLHPRNPAIRQAEKFPIPQDWCPTIRPIYHSKVEMSYVFPKHTQHVPDMPYKNVLHSDPKKQQEFRTNKPKNIKSPLLNNQDTDTPGDSSNEQAEENILPLFEFN